MSKHLEGSEEMDFEEEDATDDAEHYAAALDSDDSDESDEEAADHRAKPRLRFRLPPRRWPGPSRRLHLTQRRHRPQP